MKSTEQQETYSHNRIKNHILKEGMNIPPLVDMGIFTYEGKIKSAMQHKFKQINRFLEMINDTIKDDKPISVVDFGCGKSYLTFVVYHWLEYIKGIKTTMVGLDLKSDVIENCKTVAKKYNYDGLSFQVGDIEHFAKNNKADMVIALHACDTATDYALYHAIKMRAKTIFAAPCCQHELKPQIKTDIKILTRYGTVKERFSALVTDAIRTNLMAYSGYKTDLMEFVDLSHTPKNLLIRAVKTKMPHSAKDMYLQEVKDICDMLDIKPMLYELLVN